MSFSLADKQKQTGQLRDRHQQLGSKPSGSNNKKNTNSSQSSSSQGKASYPAEFYCPISHCLMLEPVMDREGNTYERTSIEQWLTNHNTSPITRNSLNANHLAVNRALVGLIESELKRRGDQPELEKRKAWQDQRDQRNRDSLSRVCLSESDIIARVEAAGNKITKKFYNGAEYYGQAEGGQYHGYGTYTGPDGFKYVGEWKNGQQDGNGSCTFAGGQKYVGEWKNDNMHGQGTYTNADGTIHHSGEWVNDLAKEEGETKNSSSGLPPLSSDSSESDIIARVEAAGNKIRKNYDGVVYYGQMEGGKWHGYGTFTYANGDKIVGELKNGKQDGYGTETFANGDKYVGPYKDNKRHGYGTFTFADGTIETGEWVNGVDPTSTSASSSSTAPASAAKKKKSAGDLVAPPEEVLRVSQGGRLLAEGRSLMEALEVCEGLAEQGVFDRRAELVVVLGRGVHEVVGTWRSPWADTYQKTLSVPFDNMSFVGQGERETIVEGCLVVEKGRTVSFEGVTVKDSSVAGLFATGARTQMVLQNVKVENNHNGVQVRDGAKLDATECHFHQNRGDGVSVKGSTTTARLTNCTSHHNKYAGVKADSGAVVDLMGEQTSVHDNEGYGLFAGDRGTTINVYQPCVLNDMSHGNQEQNIRGYNGGRVSHLAFTH